MSIKNKWKHRSLSPVYTTFMGTFGALVLWSAIVAGVLYLI